MHWWTTWECPPMCSSKLHVKDISGCTCFPQVYCSYPSSTWGHSWQTCLNATSHSAPLLQKCKVRWRRVSSGYTSAKCPNCTTPVSGEVYYTDEVIKDVLLSKIADMDIRRETHSMKHIMVKSITDVIALIESKKTTRNAKLSTTVVSSFLSIANTTVTPSSNPESNTLKSVLSHLPYSISRWWPSVQTAQTPSTSTQKRRVAGIVVHTHNVNHAGGKELQSRQAPQGQFPRAMMIL